MRRQFRLNKARGVTVDGVDYEAMTDDDLVVYAIGQGLPGFCERWKRETIIKKLEALAA